MPMFCFLDKPISCYLFPNLCQPRLTRHSQDPRPFASPTEREKKKVLDKFKMKSSFFITPLLIRQFAREAAYSVYMSLPGCVSPPFAGSLYGMVAPHKKRERRVWINTVRLLRLRTRQQMKRASDGPAGKCKRRGETKGERLCCIMARAWFFFLLCFNLQPFQKRLFHNRLLTPPLLLSPPPPLRSFYTDTYLLCASLRMPRLSSTDKCNIQSTSSIWGNTPSVSILTAVSYLLAGAGLCNKSSYSSGACHTFFFHFFAFHFFQTPPSLLFLSHSGKNPCSLSSVPLI